MTHIAYNPTRVHVSERHAGKRATFHVYYNDGQGRLLYDPSWELTEDAAGATFEGFFKELGMVGAKVVEVVKTEGGL